LVADRLAAPVTIVDRASQAVADSLPQAGRLPVQRDLHCDVM
jgi:hypothetical protein